MMGSEKKGQTMHLKDSEKYVEDKIQNLFTFHAGDDIDINRFHEIRSAAKELARAIYRNAGERFEDAEISVQKLRECVYFAIASIVVPK